MTRRILRAAAIAAVIGAATAGTAQAIVPANGGDVGASIVAVNIGPGDQTDPHVSGDLAVYTNATGGSSSVHYVDFTTGTDSVVPETGFIDSLPDVNGGRISFSRQSFDGATLTIAAMVFDVSSGVLRDLDPQPGSQRFGVVVGGNTVAYQELNSGNGDVYAYDLASGTATNLTQSPERDENPAVAPSGDVVVWERCVGSNCDIYRSVRTSGAWGAPTLVAATTSNDGNPDTDGTTVVYDSDRPSATAQDIYFQPVAGGAEVPLELAGIQGNPNISRGVIAFESKSSPIENADIYMYVIATNTLYRVTDTATVDESLNDVAVLPDGRVRVVLAADDDVGGNHNIYARTFTVPLTAGAFTDQFLSPLQQSTDPARAQINTGKNGRVVPVKVQISQAARRSPA